MCAQETYRGVLSMFDEKYHEGRETGGNGKWAVVILFAVLFLLGTYVVLEQLYLFLK